ncbi:hypothetical protein Lsan_3506 [Legionella santicrucis]|uniref:Uncharacterized protein n=1 Tax=Legionella santicrucis TaxID=45074 RepID=A0A0W0YAT7_9GAMM|nr:hypothetical protein Lsan_3506 [Legionella santicrucis]
MDGCAKRNYEIQKGFFKGSQLWVSDYFEAASLSKPVFAYYCFKISTRWKN